MKFDSDYVEATVVSVDERGYMQIVSQGTEWQITSYRVIQDFVNRYNQKNDEKEDWKRIATSLYNYYYLNEGHSSCVKEYEDLLNQSRL